MSILLISLPDFLPFLDHQDQLSPRLLLLGQVRIT